eukprot:2849358-Pleurochrysis_carterae.AAC.1
MAEKAAEAAAAGATRDAATGSADQVTGTERRRLHFEDDVPQMAQARAEGRTRDADSTEPPPAQRRRLNDVAFAALRPKGMEDMPAREFLQAIEGAMEGEGR